jgi:hypothetical protein
MNISTVQRDVLELIMRDQATAKKAAEPERAILLWSQGVSERTTAQRLRISREDVRLIRERWWTSKARIAAQRTRGMQSNTTRLRHR